MILKRLLFIGLLVFFNALFAAVYPLPPQNDALIGDATQTRVKWGDNFASIARRFDVGYREMILVNPKFDPEAPPIFYKVLVPSAYILPPGPRIGIVINLPEMRLYYYMPHENKVLTVPVGIGEAGWGTPKGNLKIIEKIENPTWVVPESIRRRLAAEGYHVPHSVPPGPQNPLGDFALRLSRPMYLIHGTNDPTSIGTRASSGCIRLYPEDIKTLFSDVSRGTPVRIVDEPYKVGWHDGMLFLSAYPPLAEDTQKQDDSLAFLHKLIADAVKDHPVSVNWDKVTEIALTHNGVPQPISEAPDQADSSHTKP